jgi:hypothetical protein
MKPSIRRLALATALVAAPLLLGACRSSSKKPPALKTLEQNRWSQLFKMVDADGDGKITREEFQTHYVPVTWMYLDKNGDGVLTTQEWAIDGMSQQRQDWFRGLDATGNGEVTRAEFERAVTPEGVDYFFKLMDGNQNGVITRKDLGIE